MNEMKFLILPNYGKENTEQCTRQVVSTLEQLGCQAVTVPLCRERFDGCRGAEKLGAGQIPADCHAVIAIGGDGTMMHAAKFAAEAGKPVLGINTGSLGFMAGLEAADAQLVSRLVSGEYTTQQRMLLDVELVRGGEVTTSCHAINDAVVSRGALSRIITLKVHHNGGQALELRADGLIISTPTGSTAYALSAGGPVIDPSFRCIEVTPVCPHSLMDRAIIFDSDSELLIEADRRREDYLTLPDDRVTLAVDGESTGELLPGDMIRVRRSAICAQFIMIKKQSFANLLTQKFLS